MVWTWKTRCRYAIAEIFKNIDEDLDKPGALGYLARLNHAMMMRGMTTLWAVLNLGEGSKEQREIRKEIREAQKEMEAQ